MENYETLQPDNEISLVCSSEYLFEENVVHFKLELGGELIEAEVYKRSDSINRQVFG